MTSTDLAVVDEPDGAGALVLPSGNLGMLDQLESWMKSASIAQKLAAVLCHGPFAPKGFRGVPEATATAILAGMELGFSPSRALRSFHVVESNATLSAESMRALVTAKGHEIKVIRGTDGATVRARRKGTTEWLEVTFTIEDAITAELVGRDPKTGKLVGARDNWRKYPITMCGNRATTQMCKDNFADVIGGMDGFEEMQDLDPASIRVEAEIVGDASPRPTAAAILARVEPPAPPAPEEPPAPVRNDPAPTVAGPSETGEAISERTVQQINTLFVRGGVTGPGQTEKRKRVIEHIVQHPVSALRDLTEAEGATVAERLHHGGRDLIGTALAQTGFQGEPQPPSTPAEPPQAAEDHAEDHADQDPQGAEVQTEEPPAEPEGWQQ